MTRFRPIRSGSEPPAEVPLSFAQRRLWFLNRLDPSSASYNETIALQLTAPVDDQALQAAVRDILGRHAALRTAFPARGGVPRQEVRPSGGAAEELRAQTMAGAELLSHIAKLANLPFDLTIDLPFRPYLFATRSDRRLLVLVIHHIAIDGWSISRVLLPELIAAYLAHRRGEIPRFTPLPITYIDYTLWQLEALGSEHDGQSLLSSQIRYWRRALAGVPSSLTLPTDRPRPPATTFRGGKIGFHIDGVLHEALIGLSRSERASLFMTVLAAIGALLARLGAGNDIPIGFPVAGRTNPATVGVVGFFANTLVARVDTSGHPTFRDLLKRVKRNTLDAYANADVPFDRLVEALRPARSTSRNPLFQVMLAFQTTLAAPAQVDPEDGGIARVPVSGTNHSRFDLTFKMTERRAPGGIPGGVPGTIQFSSDLFESSTVGTIAERLLVLLRSVVVNADQPIDQIDLRTDQERGISNV